MGHNRRKLARMPGALAILTLIAIVSPAYGIDFHFSPLNISVEAKPGQVVNRTFTLTPADEASPTHFKARVEDWWRSADNLQTFYAAPGTIPRSCGKWCTINPVESAATPGEDLTIKLSIRVPQDAKPGGYWAALTLDEILDPLAPRPKGVAVMFRSSISVGIFVEIPPVKRSARIVGVEVGEDSVAVTMRNDGDMPLRVNGTFEFYKGSEEQPVASVKLGAEPLLPGPVDTCRFSTGLPDAETLPSGKYRVRVIIDVGLDYLLGAEKELELTRRVVDGS